MNSILKKISRTIWPIDDKKAYFGKLVAGFRSAAWPELKNEVEEAIVRLYSAYDKCETHAAFLDTQSQIKALATILEIENIEIMASISERRKTNMEA